MTETPKPESVELLPCPFCGGMAGIVLQKTGPSTGRWFIDCCGLEEDYGAECPADMSGGTREEVISFWNRRTLSIDTEAIRRVRDEMAQIEAEIDRDERYHYPTAIVQVNAPLALIQLQMKTRIQLARQVRDALDAILARRK